MRPRVMTLVSEGGNVPGEVSDHGGELQLRGGSVGVAVGLYDPLVDAPGGVECSVLIRGERTAPATALGVGEEVRADAGHGGSRREDPQSGRGARR